MYKGEPTTNRVQSTDAGVSVKISLLNLCRATRKKTRLSLLELPRCDLRNLMSSANKEVKTAKERSHAKGAKRVYNHCT